MTDANLTAGVERVDRRTFAAVDGSPVLLRSAAAVDASGTATSVFRRAQPFTVEVDISVETQVSDLNIAISIRSIHLEGSVNGRPVSALRLDLPWELAPTVDVPGTPPGVHPAPSRGCQAPVPFSAGVKHRYPADTLAPVAA